MCNSEILIELGNRIKACRIRKRLTQVELATLSGVSKGTVANVENGESIQLENLLKILRELDLLNSLEILLPSSDSSPMELIQLKSGNKCKRVRKTTEDSVQSGTVWKWGEDK